MIFLEIFLAKAHKFRNNFHAKNFSLIACDLCQKSSCPARTRSHIKNLFSLRWSKKFEHKAHGAGLGDCLAMSNGKGIILIRLFLIFSQYEIFAVNSMKSVNDMRTFQDSLFSKKFHKLFHIVILSQKRYGVRG